MTVRHDRTGRRGPRPSGHLYLFHGGGSGPETKTALMVISTEAPTPSEVVETLRGTDGIQDIHLIALR